MLNKWEEVRESCERRKRRNRIVSPGDLSSNLLILSGQVETVVKRCRWACEADFMLSSPTSAEQLSLSVVSLEQFEQGCLCA